LNETGNMGAKPVLLLSNEPATVSAVTAALQRNGKLASDDICRSMSDVTHRLELARCAAVLVDIDTNPHQTLSAVEPLARRFGETRFIVLSTAMHNDLLLEAMKVGARHFLLKDAIVSDLHDVIKRLCSDGAPASSGSAVTVLSAGGGCGATTLAVNLAAELHLLGKDGQREPALVVDLDPYYGAVAAYLGAEGEYGIFDLLGRTDLIDSQLIQSTVLSHSPTLHALISTPRDRLGEPNFLDPERLGKAVEACKAAYEWTVIDAPRVSTAAAAELARHSAMTLLLLQLTVKDIRAARRMLVGLAERGVPAESVRVFATRYRKRRRLIDPVEARKALGLASDRPLGLLSNDYKAVSKAVNLGKPLSQAAPRSDFRRDLQKLAAETPSPRKTK
jgi:Flp pilus assembly CpaE family ATPase